MTAHEPALSEIRATGWRMGFSNFLRKETRRWWRTGHWTILVIVLLFLVDGLMMPVLWADPQPTKDYSLGIFFVNAGIFPAIAVTIVIQDALVEEKRLRTAGWVLSKPISRTAFLLAKWIANSLGFFLTAVVLPGLGAFVLFRTVPPWTVRPLDLALGMGLVTLFLLFSLTLTLMLGTFFSGRGPVIGLTFLVLLAQNYLVEITSLQPFLPASLVSPI